MIPDAESAAPSDSPPPRSGWRSDKVVRDGAVLGVAVGLFGAAFGVLAVDAGLSVAQTSAMSLLVFTGASQITAVSVLATGGTMLAALGGAFLLAMRNGVYGVSLARRLQVRGLRRLLSAQLVIDESTAMAIAQSDDRIARRAFWATGISIFVAWNVGTLLGAVTGDAIGDPERFGLDAAFPAGFVALLMPQLRDRATRTIGFVAVAIALVAIPFVPAGLPVLLAAVAAGLAARSVPSRSIRDGAS